MELKTDHISVERAETNFKQRLNDILLKPFIMLALEPMLLAVTLYMSFVYGLVYLLFEAFPFVFVINVSDRRRAVDGPRWGQRHD